MLFDLVPNRGLSTPTLVLLFQLCELVPAQRWLTQPTQQQPRPSRSRRFAQPHDRTDPRPLLPPTCQLYLRAHAAAEARAQELCLPAAGSCPEAVPAAQPDYMAPMSHFEGMQWTCEGQWVDIGHPAAGGSAPLDDSPSDGTWSAAPLETVEALDGTAHARAEAEVAAALSHAAALIRRCSAVDCELAVRSCQSAASQCSQGNS